MKVKIMKSTTANTYRTTKGNIFDMGSFRASGVLSIHKTLINLETKSANISSTHP